MTDQALEVAVGYASITYFAISFALFILSFIAQALVVKILEPNDNRLESPRASDETGQKA